MAFKSPSSRRRSDSEQININLVPMLDALVTMIAFLMYTMAFMQLTMVESPLPIVSSQQNQEKLKERPLQLTLTIHEDSIEIWSPFELIPSVKIPNTAEKAADVIKVHEALLGIKQKFPTENKLVLVPYKGTSYDTIVSVLDNSRLLEKTDPVILAKNKDTGIDEPVKTLFSEVVFGNLLGGGE